MRNFKWIYGGLFAAFGAVTLPAVAQETPGLLEAERDTDQWYVGASAARSDYDINGLDNMEWGYKVFGGYQHNRWLGAQIGYVELGEFDARNGGDVDVDGFEIAAIGRYPFTQKASVFGKVGAYAWDASVSGTGVPVEDDDGTDATVGIGAEYLFNDQFGTRVELERFMDVGEEDIDALSVGAVIRF